MQLSYEDKLRLVKGIKSGDVWVNIKTGRTATVIMRKGMNLVLKHQSGRQTTKQDHYFAGDFEPAPTESVK